MGTILARYRYVGILCVIEKLNRSVRALMACVPKCIMCNFEMLSEPMLNVSLVLPVILLTICVVNGGVMFVLFAF